MEKKNKLTLATTNMVVLESPLALGLVNTNTHTHIYVYVQYLEDSFKLFRVRQY